MRQMLLSFLLIFTSLQVWAIDAPYQEGTDYQLLHITQQPPKSVIVDKNTVIEFFSYACPHCASLHPAIETWLEKKPKTTKFMQVPVVYQKAWEIYARAYYIADAFGVEEKISPAIFKALHEDKNSLQTSVAMANLFAAHGADKEKVLKAFERSAAIDAKLREGTLLSRLYRITTVPMFIVGGKYKVDMSLAGGDSKRMFAIIDYLVEKG